MRYLMILLTFLMLSSCSTKEVGDSVNIILDAALIIDSI